MSNNKRTPPKQPYRPSFITPPPPHTVLYGTPSESQVNANNAESQATNATEVLSDDEDLSPTPPLSQHNNSGAAQSATPGASSLKGTYTPGFKGNPLFFNDDYKWVRRHFHENGQYTNVPSNEFGEPVPVNDPRRNARRYVANVKVNIANLSSATPVSRRNVTARAAASAAAEAEEESDQVVASTLFSPAVARPSALSLTPHDRPPRNRNSQNSPRKNTSANRNRKGGSRKKRTYRKKRTQHKKTRRSHY